MKPQRTLFVTSMLAFNHSVDSFGITDLSSLNHIHNLNVQSFSDQVSIILSNNNDSSLNLLDLYKDNLASHPLTTKALTGGTLAVCGDAIAQSQTDEEYDRRRASSFAAFDMVYRGVQHVSFPTIVNACHGQYIAGFITTIPGLSSIVHNLGWDNLYYYGAMEQTLASQLGIVPFFYYPVFYTLTSFIQGLDTEAAIQRAKNTFIPLMKRNLLFWIPVQFVQFGFIDENLQIPFLSLCGLMWTFIISVFAGNAKSSVVQEQQQEELTYELLIDDQQLESMTVEMITPDDVNHLEERIFSIVEEELYTEKTTQEININRKIMEKVH